MTNLLSASLKSGLSAPICLTWELTYGCNLSCIHCLSDSGPKAKGELTRLEALGLIDQFAAMGIFYVNIGGGEPMMRRDFFDIISHATKSRIGVKFSTNGTYLDLSAAKSLSSLDYIDIQISLDGPDAKTNDAIRGLGSFDKAIAALENLSRAEFRTPKISVVATRNNVEVLDDLMDLANYYQANLRITRLRPSGRGVASYQDLNPSPDQQRQLYNWLSQHSEVLTGDSFFHLSPLGPALAGLNMCGAGRIVCLVDPIGDVYACPFTIDPQFRAGNIRNKSFSAIWQKSQLFESLRQAPGPSSCQSCSAYAKCQGGCMAAKFHTGATINDPDPDCVLGKGKETSTRTMVEFLGRKPSHQR